jgi:hypothetical protein
MTSIHFHRSIGRADKEILFWQKGKQEFAGCGLGNRWCIILLAICFSIRPFLQGTLQWFPTDAILSDARECLQYMAEEKSFLFSDKTGQAVFAGDKVELIDLPRYEFKWA